MRRRRCWPGISVLPRLDSSPSLGNLGNTKNDILWRGPETYGKPVTRYFIHYISPSIEIAMLWHRWRLGNGGINITPVYFSSSSSSMHQPTSVCSPVGGCICFSLRSWVDASTSAQSGQIEAMNLIPDTTRYYGGGWWYGPRRIACRSSAR